MFCSMASLWSVIYLGMYVFSERWDSDVIVSSLREVLNCESGQDGV